MTVVYHDADGDLNVLREMDVAVIGYGNMGRPIALNLRDSGVSVIVSEPSAEKHAIVAADGFTVTPIPDAVRKAQIIMILVRDEHMPSLYLQQISPHLQRGQTLLFSSAYNVAFGFIEAPPFVDVSLVSAKTMGAAVRERFLSGEGFASFVAVAQDASRNAWPVVLAVAKAMGALRGGAVEIRFEQEAELDLFVQQTLLPLFHQAMTIAARLLNERGYPSEAVFTELYLSGEVSDYLHWASTLGLMGTLELQGLTAQYGMLTRMDRFNDLKLERLMEQTLTDVRDGRFAQEWSREYSGDYPRLRQLLKQRKAMDLWALERETIEELKPPPEG
ncbi:MAG: NAD(P)-binding domain-containing protein [Anaerolineae bacterium]